MDIVVRTVDLARRFEMGDAHVDALRGVGRDNSWAARARAMSGRIERAVAERRGVPA